MNNDNTASLIKTIIVFALALSLMPITNITVIAAIMPNERILNTIGMLNI